MDESSKTIKLLNENPRISNKMKYFEKENGTWLARLRSNQCHQFHSNDSIAIGIVKKDCENLIMKITIRMKNNKLKAIKCCENHSQKFRSKV